MSFMLQMSNPSNPLGVNAPTNSCDQSKESPQSDPCLMAEKHHATNHGDKSPCLLLLLRQGFALIWSI